MPKANTSDVYPSLVNLTTGPTGDLLEVTGAPALSASLELYSGTSGAVQIESVAKSADANNIKIEIVENNGGTDHAEYDADTNTVSVLFRDNFIANFGGSYDSAIYNTGITLTAVQLGDLAQTLQFTVLDNVAGATQDEVKVNASDGDVTVCLQNDISTYTNADIWDLLTNTVYAWVSTDGSAGTIQEVMTPSQNASYVGTDVAVNNALTLQGGVDPSGQVPAEGTAKITSLINDTAETSAIVVATGGDTSLPVAVAPTNLSGGQDLINSDLDFNSEYVCIKRSEIHDLEADEMNDARKILWGMLETYTQFILGQNAEQQPENFLVARGAPALLQDNAGLRIRQTYTINAFYGVSDFDLEDETEA